MNTGERIRQILLPPPVVVNLRAGQIYDEYIGLGTRWGNPYYVNHQGTSTRKSAISAYERRMRNLLKDAGWRIDLKGLSGKRLGCHCHPLPCHGDVLVKLFLELWGSPGKLESCDGNHNTAAGSSGSTGESR